MGPAACKVLDHLHAGAWEVLLSCCCVISPDAVELASLLMLWTWQACSVGFVCLLLVLGWCCCTTHTSSCEDTVASAATASTFNIAGHSSCLHPAFCV